MENEIKSDLKQAQLARDEIKVSTLRLLLSEIKNREISKGQTLSDGDIVTVCQREIKKRKDAVEQYEKGGRPELAEGEKKEAETLMVYMPEQMSEEAVRNEIKKAIAETGIKDIKEMGKLIGAVMAKIKGKADGSLVSKIVKEELSK